MVGRYEIFQHERNTNEQRALGILLYYAGLSYKKVKRAYKGRLPRIFIDRRLWYLWTLDTVGFKRYTVILLVC